jgi:small subunit ribosomal protein S8
MRRNGRAREIPHLPNDLHITHLTQLGPALRLVNRPGIRTATEIEFRNAVDSYKSGRRPDTIGEYDDMMTDPIADMLTRVRNASQAKHKRVDMPVSRLKTEIARILKENHFIHDFKVLDDGAHGVLRIYLKYYEDKPVIRNVERVSRPGRRIYKGATELPRIRSGLGIAIVSTSKGMMSDRQARAQKVGGEVMALVW